MTQPSTLFDKIWSAHEVGPGLLYIDLHLVHEVTSPQAFDGLRLAGRTVRRPDRTLATADHNTPTDGTPVAARIRDELSRVQVQTLERNCEEFGVPVYSLGFGVTAKDLILGTIGQMGVDGAVGHVVEYAGPAIERLSMEGRMTVCNMTIEGGGRAGMIAPDDTTLEYMEGRPAAPKDWNEAVERWRALPTEDGASFDRE